MRAVTGGRYQLPATMSQPQALKQMPISPNLLAEPYKCAFLATSHPCITLQAPLLQCSEMPDCVGAVTWHACAGGTRHPCR
jgi:hypothetical protein